MAKDAAFGKQIGAFLHRMMDSDTVLEIVPQFSRQKGGTMTGQPLDQKFAQAIPVLETFRGVFEGLGGLETTMLCPRAECPFHQFRICDRVSFIPDEADSYRQRHVLETEYKLTPEILSDFRPDTRAADSA
jgi:hypothetical protein